MRCHSSARPSFQPQLERLETRDLLSAAGFALPGLIQPLSQLSQQMTTDLQKMNTDFSQLKNDVSAAPGPFDAVTPTLTDLAPISNDYTKVANDLGQIEALNTLITTTAKVDQIALLVGMMDGTFDSNDFLAISLSLNIIKSATSTAATDLAQAMDLANTTLPNGFPTVNTTLQS